MLLRLTQSIFIVLVLTCCGCQESQVNNASASSDINGLQNGPTVIVYYFHGTRRCFSCLTVETNAAQVIEDNFQQQIADGSLMWTPMNMEDPGNKEITENFGIKTNTLVVAKMADGNYLENKKLKRVWQLIDDPEGFSEYVTDEINAFLKDK
jgi:hypothetical protein